jgi:N utilization substance protein A
MGVEKIDLVRWNEDIGTYILNSLSPAKSQEIHLDKDNKRATILLEDEQLKLAIGKKGQNVRLASRLTGWQIDLRKREEIVSNLTSLPGVGESTAGALMEAGIRRIEDLAKATPEQLTEVKGIGEKKAENLIDAAKRHVQIAKSK